MPGGGEGEVTIKAIKSGNWADATVWDLSRIPVVGDIIDLAGFAVTFNIDLPAVASVLDTDTMNGVAGTYHAPETSEVQAGVHFGAGSIQVGTYPGTATGSMTIQRKIDAILSPVFDGRLYYIQHPDPDGSEVAETFSIFSVVGGECFENLEGDMGAARPRVQVSIYTIDSTILTAKVKEVNDAMSAASILAQTNDPDTTETALLNYSSSVPVDGYETETRRFYSHMDFYCGDNQS